MNSLPTVQQINLLKDTEKDIIIAFNWIYRYQEIMNPMQNKISPKWYIPKETEGLLTIKKSLLFLNSYYYKYYIQKERSTKHACLISEIKNKIANIYANTDQRYYELKRLYDNECNAKKELEKKYNIMVQKYYQCKNDLHTARIELKREKNKKNL